MSPVVIVEQDDGEVIECYDHHDCPHQWQPIDTALPYVDVWGLTEDGQLTAWPDDEGRWWCRLPTFNDFWQCFPTHWMPLPEPPNAD